MTTLLTPPLDRSDVMKSGATITIPDHVSGPKTERIRQPGLPGRWCVWSKVSGGPGWHAVTPVGAAARATGIKYATVRIQFAKNAATPLVTLIATDPYDAMPAPIKEDS